MKKGVFVFLFSTLLLCLNTCIANSEERILPEIPKLVTDAPVDPNGPVPLGFSMVVEDIPCKYIINSISIRLEMLGFMFEWTDQDMGLVTVGPITQELETGSTLSTVRETYFLKTVLVG